jgi:hypothetical protein
MRRPAAVSLTILLSLAAMLLLFWPQPRPPDPEGPARQIRRELQQGQPVTLIGQTGRPPFLRWSVGEAGTSRPDDSAEGFSLQSFSGTLATLVPSPGVPRYTFRAEVAHEQGTLASEVGLFFGLQTHETAAGIRHFFCAWTFSDQFIPRMANRPIPNFQNKPKMDLYSWLNPDARDPKVVTFSSKGGIGGGVKGASFTPAGPALKERTWRSLAVHISPDGISASWDGKRCLSFTRAELRDRLGSLYESVPELQGRDPSPNMDAPLGLYLIHGSATFKHVVVEPR